MVTPFGVGRRVQAPPGCRGASVWSNERSRNRHADRIASLLRSAGPAWTRGRPPVARSGAPSRPPGPLRHGRRSGRRAARPPGFDRRRRRDHQAGHQPDRDHGAHVRDRSNRGKVKMRHRLRGTGADCDILRARGSGRRLEADQQQFADGRRLHDARADRVAQLQQHVLAEPDRCSIEAAVDVGSAPLPSHRCTMAARGCAIVSVLGRGDFSCNTHPARAPRRRARACPQADASPDAPYCRARSQTGVDDQVVGGEDRVRVR